MTLEVYCEILKLLRRYLSKKTGEKSLLSVLIANAILSKLLTGIVNSETNCCCWQEEVGHNFREGKD